MKILHIIDSGGLYGAETMLLHLMVEQLRLGISPVLASIGLPTDKEKPIEIEARRSGLDVIPFRMRSGPNWVGALNLLRFAHQNHVHLLHSHGYKGNILFGFLPRMLRQLPMVSTLHGWTSMHEFSRMRLYEWLETVSLRFVDRVVVVNGSMLEHPRLKSLSSDKLTVVENGISIAVSAPINGLCQKIRRFTEKQFTFGAVGRLSPEKGFAFLLQAFAGLVAAGNDVQLVILGEGEQRTFLEAMIKKLHLEEKVLLPGFVKDAKNYLPLFKAFVLPSLTEGLPLVLLEAMVNGIPIVATRVGGVPVVLADGRGGVLIEAGDVRSLQRAMFSVFADTEEAEERTIWAFKRVQEGYSSRIMAEKYGQIYLELA